MIVANDLLNNILAKSNIQDAYNLLSRHYNKIIKEKVGYPFPPGLDTPECWTNIHYNCKYLTIDKYCIFYKDMSNTHILNFIVYLEAFNRVYPPPRNISAPPEKEEEFLIKMSTNRGSEFREWLGGHKLDDYCPVTNLHNLIQIYVIPEHMLAEHYNDEYRAYDYEYTELKDYDHLISIVNNPFILQQIQIGYINFSIYSIFFIPLIARLEQETTNA